MNTRMGEQVLMLASDVQPTVDASHVLPFPLFLFVLTHMLYIYIYMYSLEEGPPFEHTFESL